MDNNSAGHDAGDGNGGGGGGLGGGLGQLRRPTLGRKLFRLKSLDDLQDTEANSDDSQFRKVLGTRDLVSLGVGSCVGTGMYLVSGMVARRMAGPAVVLSYAVAGVAALLSGFCYAELGVRAPHTTGSAYVYSYVTVGEFVAFVIGWNMILEYIIGTAACACALSACLDILSSGWISNITDAWAGPGEIMGAPPDVLAFTVTLLMTLLFFFGVKKSVVFNHVLNVANLASWIITVGIGLFFVRAENWKDFMPFGFSGVMKGAATCFYAFIGFDIIATTGQEAKTPRESIPKAIIASILIVTVAYVSCSAIMTLMVPYNELSEDAGLVQVWGQVDYPSIEWLISIGALGALTVSMFGSMFPMPRVAYAMSKDGLLCSTMSRVNGRGVPACATLWLGLLSAVCALLFPLDVLIEMMSVGTLLAYTLVDCCVLILRFQPERRTIIEQLERAEMETIGDPEPAPTTPLSPTASSSPSQATLTSTLMSLVHGRHPAQTAPACTRDGGRISVRVFLSLSCFVLFFDLCLVFGADLLSPAVSVAALFASGLVVVLHVIALAHFPQSRPSGFNTPGVPLVPVLGILINIYLMFRLSSVTLIRFSVWMLIGLIIYFKYGIWESAAEDWK